MRKSAAQFTYHQATNKDLLELHYSSQTMLLDPDVPVTRRNQIVRESPTGNYFAYVARDSSGRLAGYITYKVNRNHEVKVLTKAVSDGLEKQGIGKKLFGLMQAHAKKLGAKVVSANAIVDSIGFYKRLKFPVPPKEEIEYLRRRSQVVPIEKPLPNVPRIKKLNRRR